MDILEFGSKIFVGIDNWLTYQRCHWSISIYRNVFRFFKVNTDNAAVVYCSFSIIVLFFVIGITWMARFFMHKFKKDSVYPYIVPIWIFPFSFLFSAISAKTIDFLPYFHERLSSALSLASSILAESSAYKVQFSLTSGIPVSDITQSKIASFYYDLTQKEWTSILSADTDYSLLTEHLYDTFRQIRDIPILHINVTETIYHSSIWPSIILFFLIMKIHVWICRRYVSRLAKGWILSAGFLAAVCSIYLPLIFLLLYSLMLGMAYVMHHAAFYIIGKK